VIGCHCSVIGGRLAVLVGMVRLEAINIARLRDWGELRRFHEGAWQRYAVGR
jgi:hypothetical protein